MDKKFSHIGDPITNLIEECAELIQALTKAKRFGLYNFHPKDPKETPNIRKIMDEWNDVTIRYAQLIQKVNEEDPLEEDK